MVWQSQGGAGTDTDGTSVWGRLYDGATSVGGEFQVNSLTTGYQLWPSVAADPSGGAFLVVWGSWFSAGTDSDGLSIHARRVASSGTPLGTDEQVNTSTIGYQSSPSVGMGPTGEAVVVWQSDSSAGSDTDGRSVQAQRFEGYPALGNGVPVAGVVPPVGAGGPWRFFQLLLPEGCSDLLFDLDLYVRHSLKPTALNYDCRPQELGTDPEQCAFTVPDPGYWWVVIMNHDAFSPFSFTLEASWLDPTLIFADGFESGTAGLWSSSVPD